MLVSVDAASPDYAVLGALEVWHRGCRVEIGHARQRTVLALLLTQPGTVFSAEQLVDLVWGEAAPSSALNVLYGYLGRLRRILAVDPAAVLGRRAGGYALDLEPARIDLHRFHELLRAGRTTGADHDVVATVRAGLALWRGTPFADLRCSRLEQIGQALERDRVGALHECHQRELRLGRDPELVSELENLVEQYPLDEVGARHLMIALYRTGHQAAAIDRYTRTRLILAQELGISPGEPLQETYGKILRAEPVEPDTAIERTSMRGAAGALEDFGRPLPRPDALWRPAQLPGDIGGFSGRDQEVDILQGLLHPDGPPSYSGGSVAVVALDGLPGVGKTAIAVHWAHQLAERYPDGQLYADLRGYHEDLPPMSATEVLGRFLRALGVRPRQMPTDPDELAPMFRSFTSGRRIVVLLDNAASAAQVRPLLPGTGSCLTIVTSRHRLTTLVAREGARIVSVRPLNPEGSLAVLRGALGLHRIDQEPEAARQVIELCAGLPLALRIVAANVAAPGGRTLADAVIALCDSDGLSAFATPDEDDPTIRRAFDMSYRVLGATCQQLFRRLGLLAGSDFTAQDAAALMNDQEAAAARSILEQLEAANMVDRSIAGRYRLHDLLRVYAQQKLWLEESPAQAASARGRLLAWYLNESQTSARQLRSRRAGTDPGSGRTTATTSAVGPSANTLGALRWFENERSNLLATIHECAERGPFDVAWQLVEAMRGFFRLRPYSLDSLVAAQAGLAAAVREGDVHAIASMHLTLADAHQTMGNDDQALQHDMDALQLCADIGWVEGQAVALGGLGRTCWALGRLADSFRHLETALAQYQVLGDPVGEAVTWGSLGRAHHDRGDLAAAVSCYLTALDLSATAKSQFGQALVSFYLGVAELDRQQLQRGVVRLHHALVIADAIHLEHVKVLALSYLAYAHSELGQQSQAVDYLRRAATGVTGTGDRRVDAECRNAIALASTRLGDLDTALIQYDRALAVAGQVKYQRGRLHAMLGLARTYRALGDEAAALRHLHIVQQESTAGGYLPCLQVAEAELRAPGSASQSTIPPFLEVQ